MQIATISSGKQVTLNNSMLAHLGLKPKGKVLLEETEEGILMKPMKKSVVEETAGSLRRFIKDEKLLKVNDKKALDVAMTAMAEHVAKEGR